MTTTPDGAKRRLSNIRPREVSLVDAAANGHKFLIVKRAEDGGAMKETEIFKDGKATTTPAPGAAPAATPPAPAKPGLFSTELQKFLDKHGTIKISKGLHMESMTMLMAMTDVLQGMGMSMDMIAQDMQAFIESGGETTFGGQRVMKSEGIEDDGIPDALMDTMVALIAKKGRKMKGARMEKLKGILQSLEKLVNELDEPSEGGTAVSKEAATNKGAETTPEAGSTSVNTNPPVAAAAAVTPAAVAPAPTTEDVAKAVGPAVEAAVAKALGTVLEPVTKKLDGIEARLTKLEGAPAAPASEPAGGTEDVHKDAGGKGGDGKGGKQESIFKNVIRGHVPA